MVNKLGLPLFVIGIFLILLSFSKNFQAANIKTTNKIQISVSPVPTHSAIEKSEAKITKVVDGDTVDVEINGKKDVVRLIGINAPETNECFGKEATDKAKEILNSKEVTLEPDSSQDDRDKYHRLLRYVFLSDGTNFGETMTRDGFAKEYTYKFPYKYQSIYKKAQQEAKDKKSGLWANGACPNPTPTPSIKGQSTFRPQQSAGGNQSFSCDCSKLCSQITSCDEAKFQLNNCGCTKRDSDGDGIPCESLCK